MEKNEVLNLLRAWINQRPGLDPRDYGGGRDGFSAYRSESRRITQQKTDALTLLRSVEDSQITADQIIEASKSAYSGRLEFKDGRISYTTGQYWPTEYRAAACAVLAYALWNYHREDATKEAESKGISAGDAIRAKFRRIFGRPIQERWFD